MSSYSDPIRKVIELPNQPKPAPLYSFEPLSSEQVAALRNKTRQVGMTGRLEMFKPSNMFDGTAKRAARVPE